MCMLRCELWVRVASKEDRFWGPFLRGLCKPHWGATGPWIHCGWLSARREQRSSHSQTDKGPHTSHKHLWVQRKTRQIQNCCGNRLTGWRLASSLEHVGAPPPDMQCCCRPICKPPHWQTHRHTVARTLTLFLQISKAPRCTTLYDLPLGQIETQVPTDRKSFLQFKTLVLFLRRE